MIWYQAAIYDSRTGEYTSLGWHKDREIVYQRAKAALLRMTQHRKMPPYTALLRRLEVIEYDLPGSPLD